MKAILGILVVAALGVGAWLVFSGDSIDPDAVSQSSEPDANGDAAETVDEAADQVEESAADAAETAEEAANDLKEQAESAVEAARSDVEEVVTETEETVDQAAEAIKQQAEEAVEEGATSVRNAVESALGGLGGGGEEADANAQGNAVETDDTANLEHDAIRPLEPGVLDQALTVESFDGLAIREALATSDLDDLTKKTVESLITMGEENPDQLQDVVAKVREIFGM